jgi:hypothetical protein
MGGATRVNANFASNRVHVCEVYVGSNKEDICILEMVVNVDTWK